MVDVAHVDPGIVTDDGVRPAPDLLAMENPRALIFSESFEAGGHGEHELIMPYALGTTAAMDGPENV
ncbi:MAG: hypothetical protein A3H95_08210 [Acidobacteria bacterium RIFCSPLOWO2_02_FULL_64_15]|nr:MAG: hypothetical protein A3H95_08210 [Acidobacteria bacterium RIFCSPLOWO2_02_FULL_64_15]